MKKILTGIALLALSPAVIATAQESRNNIGTTVRDYVLQSCLKQFGDHPFDANNLKYNVIAPTINVLGGTTVLLDDAKTEGPQLTIISTAVNVLGNATYKLLNPNGWYCLASNITVYGTTHIDLHQDAHLAKLNISVLSKVDVQKVDDNGLPVPEEGCESPEPGNQPAE